MVSTDGADANVYYLELIAALEKYPNVTQSMPFNVTIIDPCIVTAINLESDGWDSKAKNYVEIYSADGLSIPIPKFT